MFTVDERDRVRQRLLALAKEDPDVVAAAITGSSAVGGGDEWSDIDLAFGIRGDLAPALERWTSVLRDEFDAIHHWDLPSRSTIYRVFLLSDWLQTDIAFTPESDFGPRGPNWLTVFGETVELESPPASRDELVGWAWVCARDTRVCIERGRPWQALWCIESVRNNVFALASLRRGHPTRFARGSDMLPCELTERFEATLVRSLDDAELERALSAAIEVLAAELAETDVDLARKLNPMLAELAR